MSHTNDGSPEENESPFEMSADHTLTPADKVQRAFDEFVVTPLAIIWSDTRARIGLSIIVFYILMGTVGVAVVHTPEPNETKRLLAPFQNLKYPLGADALGRGLLAQLVHATPAMLKIMLSGGMWVISVGTILGLVSGYKGGKIDTAIMFASDTIMMLPGLPLLLIVVAILQPESPLVLGLILGLTGWAGLARAVRSEMLSLREANYVEASRIMGLDTGHILKNDLLPNIMPYVMINLVNSMKGFIFGSMALYFLGILPFTNLNWGVMLNNAYRQSGALYTLEAAHWLLAPMLTVMILSFGLIMFAQGSDRLFNPRVRARHESGGSVEEDAEADDDGTSASLASNYPAHSGGEQ